MIPASTAITDAIEERSRSFRARFRRNNASGEIIECNIKSIDIYTGGGGETPVPGALYSGYINATIMNPAVDIKGVDLCLQIGVVVDYDGEEPVVEWIDSVGVFRCVKTAVKENEITFTAVGRITSHAQGTYSPTVTFPATIADVLADIATQTGTNIQVHGSGDSGVIQKMMTGKTYQEALSIIASLLGGFVTEDYNGNIVISAYGAGNMYPVDYSRVSQLPSFSEAPFEASGLQCKVSPAEDLDVEELRAFNLGGSVDINEKESKTGAVTRAVDKQAQIDATGLQYGDNFELGVYIHCIATVPEDGDIETVIDDEIDDPVELVYGTGLSNKILYEQDYTHVGETWTADLHYEVRLDYDGGTNVRLRVEITRTSSSGYGPATFLDGFVGPMTVFVKHIPAVSYSGGTAPYVVVENEYLTAAMWPVMNRAYIGYNFNPAEITLTLGNPLLEPWDLIEINNGQKAWYVPCHKLVTHFSGAIWQEVSSLMAGAEDGDAAPVEGAQASQIGFALSTAQAARAAADNAQSSAGVAAKAATQAQGSASMAQTMAKSAEAAADTAWDYADRAHQAADDAQGSADRAQTSADNASEYAARALGNLSTVQSVTETLNWITEHGTMTLTSDTELNPSHVYFVLNDPPAGQTEPHGDYYVGGHYYDVVSEPNVDDISTYYELTINESLNNYVGTHLSVTSEGLWLIPEDSATGSRVLIATGQGSTYTAAGTYIIDSTGFTVASFTNSGLKLYGRDYQGNTIIYQNTAREDAFFKSRYAVLNGEILRYFRTSTIDRNGFSVTHDRGPNSYDVKTFNVQDDFQPFLELRAVDENGDNSGAYIKLGTADGDGIDIYYGGETEGERVFHVDNATGDISFKCQGYSAGTSSTAGGTITKVVTADSWSSTPNDTIYAIKFTNAPTSNVSLNINGSGAKQAYYAGSRINASNGAWSAGETVYFTYDGTRYQRTDNPDALAVAVGQLGWTSDVIE